MDYPTTSGGELVQQVRSLVEDYVQAEVVPVTDPATGVEALFVRSGNGVRPIDPKDFEPYRDAPRFRHGIATMLSLDSLIEHVNRFKDGDSVVFANDDRKNPSLTACSTITAPARTAIPASANIVRPLPSRSPMSGRRGPRRTTRR
jgi:hypothetical protein